MKDFIKKHIALIIPLLILIAAIILLCLHVWQSNEERLSWIRQCYDEDWIVGKSEAQLETAYGEFEILLSGNRKGWYVRRENGSYWSAGDSDVWCYIVTFDSDGLAKTTELITKIPPGG